MDATTNYPYHAHAEIARADALLSGLRDELAARAPGLSQRGQRAANDLLAALERRNLFLLDVYRQLEHADPVQVAQQWRRFFACYGDFLNAVREARRSLAQEASADIAAADATPGIGRAAEDAA